jgi:hypothetical protein
MVHGREKEHVAALDEVFLIGRKIRTHDQFFNPIGQPDGIEPVLQVPVIFTVNFAHPDSPYRLTEFFVLYRRFRLAPSGGIPQSSLSRAEFPSSSMLDYLIRAGRTFATRGDSMQLCIGIP